MVTGKQDDPVDSLLEKAFADELERARQPELTRRVLQQLNRQQRLRGVALGAVTAVGLLLLFAVGLPALAQLGTVLSVPEAILTRLGALLPGMETLPPGAATLALILLIAPWLWAVVDDSL